MIKYLPFLLLMFSTSSFALDCKDITGMSVPITYDENYDDFFFKYGNSGFDENDNPYIIMDYRMADIVSIAAVLFIEFHECGHHALGHARYGGILFPKGTDPRIPEYSADCYAAAQFRKMFGQENLEKVLIELEDANFFDADRREIMKKCSRL